MATAFALVRRNRHRFTFAALTLWFALCFAYSMVAPGNAVRAALMARIPRLKAVAQSLYYGVALLGRYLTLPVVAVGLALAPMLWQLAAGSRFSFRHPLWVLAGAVCLFCTQLTPPLYAGVYPGAGRITDTFYYSFVLLFC